MAERKRLSASVETSVDYLPDFRDITLQGKQSLYEMRGRNTGTLNTEQGHLVTTMQDVDLVVGLEKFRKILAQQSLDTLLLELAVVHERNLERAEIQSESLVTADNSAEQYFTSHIVSYLGRIDDKSLLISAWNRAIVSKLIERSAEGRHSIMAYPETYDSFFMAEQFNWAVGEIRRLHSTKRLPEINEVTGYEVSEAIVDARNVVLKKFKDVHQKLDEHFWQNLGAEQRDESSQIRYSAALQSEKGAHYSPTVYQKTYPFALLPEGEQARSVENSISHLVAGLVSGLVSCWESSGERSTAHLKAIFDFLMNCCLLVVPFRRPIAFGTSATVSADDEFIWGDQPGGCLFAIVRPSLGGMLKWMMPPDGSPLRSRARLCARLTLPRGLNAIKTK